MCWCGSGKKWKKCHYPQQPASKESDLRSLYRQKYRILLKTPEQIEAIRQACRLAAQILDATCKKAIAGITTGELNDFAHRLHQEAGAIPAPLHFGTPPFPKSICTSLNEVICHGIPDSTLLKEGDILNIDVSPCLRGYYGDCSRMVTIGNISQDARRVVDTSYECLMAAIATLKPGVPVHAIGEAIESHAKANGCSVVYQFVAHGVGIAFHEEPQIPHYRNRLAIPLAPGMIFTIEPMINLGLPEAIIDSDGWTARTADGKLSAQWEHTLLITDTGHEILTAQPFK